MSQITKFLRKIAIAILALQVFFFSLFPVYWLFLTSIKPPTEWVAHPPAWFTLSPILNNYLSLISPGMVSAYFEQYGYIIAQTKYSALVPILNSLVISGGATILAVIVGFLAAYSISRYGTGGRGMYFFVLTGRMFPPVAVAIPLVVMYSTLNLMDLHLGLVLIYTGVTVPYVIWMMKSFLDEVPKEVEEAAILDGCSQFEAIMKVTVPMVKGGLVASALFVFILNWGEFAFALLFTNINAYTLPVQIQRFFSIAGFAHGPMSALSIVATIPMIIFGYMIQKHFVRGLTFGAVRGR